MVGKVLKLCVCSEYLCNPLVVHFLSRYKYNTENYFVCTCIWSNSQYFSFRLAIIGATEQFLNEKVDRDTYFGHVGQLQSHVSRLNRYIFMDIFLMFTREGFAVLQILVRKHVILSVSSKTLKMMRILYRFSILTCYWVLSRRILVGKGKHGP